MLYYFLLIKFGLVQTSFILIKNKSINLMFYLDNVDEINVFLKSKTFLQLLEKVKGISSWKPCLSPKDTWLSTLWTRWSNHAPLWVRSLACIITPVLSLIEIEILNLLLFKVLLSFLVLNALIWVWRHKNNQLRELICCGVSILTKNALKFQWKSSYSILQLPLL